MITLRAALAFAAALLAPAAASAQTQTPSQPAPQPASMMDRCAAQVCTARLTPDQVANEAML
ncbi:MAG: hypothetical protein ACAH11_13205, partial [Sphingomonas sp.]